MGGTSRVCGGPQGGWHLLAHHLNGVSPFPRCHPAIGFRNMGGTLWIRSAEPQGLSRRLRFLGAKRCGATRWVAPIGWVGGHRVGGTYWQPQATSRRGGWHLLAHHLGGASPFLRCHPAIGFRNMGGTVWIRSAGPEGLSRRLRFLGAIRLGVSRWSNKVGGTY